MKILVVSLLRLGDIIQQMPLLRKIRTKHPQASVHLLLNRQFANVEAVLGDLVDQYHYFDREELQRGIGEAGFNILWSYRKLNNLIQELNGYRFDQAYNFTHNKLSAYLLGTLNIEVIQGLHARDGRFQGLESRWMKYFNERFSSNNSSVFHYIEILSQAFDLPLESPKPVSRKKSKSVLFQCLTSDPKKNWGLGSFKKLKEEIEKNLLDYKVKVLAAPFEKEVLLSVFSEDEILVCDLREAMEHLESAALLVTGDTSIKHLAAHLGTPLVELVLGSSDGVKTGAYSSGAYQIQSPAPCAPCVHSMACPQKTHLCAEMITVEEVFGQVWNALSGQEPRKNNLKTLDKMVWQSYLNRKSFSEEIQFSRKDFAAEDFADWKAETTYFNQLHQQFTDALPSRESFLERKSLSSSDLAAFIALAQEVVRKKSDRVGYFQTMFEALLIRFVRPVEVWERLNTALAESRELINLRFQLSQNIENDSKDGGYYAKGFGYLSDRSFEEARDGLQRDNEGAVL